MIKIDLKKAYDSLEWSFLRDMMIAMGFPDIFMAWVMECVSSTSYSVCINGKPCKLFEGRKGIRQGDPLSPFLFAIVMDYLSRLFDEVDTKPGFKYHPRCSKIRITHLFLLMTSCCLAMGVWIL